MSSDFNQIYWITIQSKTKLWNNNGFDMLWVRSRAEHTIQILWNIGPILSYSVLFHALCYTQALTDVCITHTNSIHRQIWSEVNLESNTMSIIISCQTDVNIENFLMLWEKIVHFFSDTNHMIKEWSLYLIFNIKQYITVPKLL